MALDVDCSLRRREVVELHLGVRRSSLRTPADALSVARAALDRPLKVVGIMFYDAQVAGLPDRGPHLKALKKRSLADLAERRGPLVERCARSLTSISSTAVAQAASVGSRP